MCCHRPPFPLHGLWWRHVNLYHTPRSPVRKNCRFQLDFLAFHTSTSRTSLLYLPNRRKSDDMENLKRKASDDGEQSRSKKKAKQWRTPKKQSLHMAPTIEPGDAGIWATCDMHKEGRATIELRDLFEDYAQKIYGQSCLNSPPDGSGEERKGESGSLVQPSVDEEVHSENKDGSDADKTPVEENDPDDIESEIAREIRSIKQPSSSTTTSSAHPPKPLIQAVRIDTQCVLFFKTRPPVEPVSFVQTICQDLSDGKASRRSRCVRRLTPMTRMGKATVGGLESVGSTVIGEVFGAKSGLKVQSRNPANMIFLQSITKKRRSGTLNQT